jgi:hypothetical protein
MFAHALVEFGQHPTRGVTILLLAANLCSDPVVTLVDPLKGGQRDLLLAEKFNLPS